MTRQVRAQKSFMFAPVLEVSNSDVWMYTLPAKVWTLVYTDSTILNSAVSVNVVKNDVNAITATHNRLAARRKCINELTALKR